MPIINGIDQFGEFYMWGHTGKRYYYNPNDSNSKYTAHKNALRQMRAIKSNRKI